MTSNTSDVDRLRAISGGHFQVGNVYASTAFVLQLAAVGFATFPALLSSVSAWTPLVSAFLALLGALMRSAACRHRDLADQMLRRVESADGAGVELRPRELADWECTARWMVGWCAKRPNEGSYFASDKAPSPARTVLNTYESAWWSKQLAGELAGVSFTGILVLVAIGVLVLRAAAITGGSPPVGATVVNASSAAILFLLTEVPLRRTLGLRTFANESARVICRAEELIDAGSVTELDAADLQTQYQLARAAAPGISSFIWKIRQRRLNELWTKVAERYSDSDSPPPRERQ